MGRLTEARTGIEANGGVATNRNEVPYKHGYAYNAFGNVTSRQTYTWTQADNQTHTWQNNRESTWSYDADGRLKQTPENKYYYDARGAIVMSTLSSNRRMIQHLDGEGKPVHQGQYQYYNYQYNLQQSEYYIYSTVLGKRLTEIKSNGTKKRTFVYGVGGVVALQQYDNNVEQVRWEHTDPSNAGYVQTSSGGVMYYDSAAELDPLGSNVGLYNPYGASPDQLQGGGWGYGSWGDPFGGFRCMVDWMERPCSDAAGILNSGIGIIGHLNWAIEVTYNGKKNIAFYQAYADGYAGFVPSNATYVGNGLVAPIGGWIADGRLIRRDSPLAFYNTGNPRSETDLGDFTYTRWNSDYNFPYWTSTYDVPALTRQELNSLRSDISDLLSDKKCAEFVAKTLAILNTEDNSNFSDKDSIFDIFDTISERGVFGWLPIVGHSAITKKYADGEGEGIIALGISTFLNPFSSSFTRAFTTIHEILHFIGKGSKPIGSSALLVQFVRFFADFYSLAFCRHFFLT